MNLNKITLDYKVNKELGLTQITIYSNGQIIPIQLVKGIKYFDFRNRGGVIEHISLIKNNWTICCFSDDENNNCFQENLKDPFASDNLYSYINQILLINSSKPQYEHLDLAIYNLLKLYIDWLRRELGYFGLFIDFDSNQNRFTKIMNEIREIMKRDGLNDYLPIKARKPIKKEII